MKISESVLLGKLTRSKLSGPDKKTELPLDGGTLLGIRTSRVMAHDGMAIAGKRSSLFPRVFIACTVKQLQGIQEQRAQVPGRFRDSISDYCPCFLPRTTNLPFKHRALPHASQWSKLYALGICSAQFQPKRSRHVGWLVSRGKRTLFQSSKIQNCYFRAELAPGYSISNSGKKSIKVLNRLGRCFMIPGVDYMSWAFAGLVFPELDT